MGLVVKVLIVWFLLAVLLALLLGWFRVLISCEYCGLRIRRGEEMVNFPPNPEKRAHLRCAIQYTGNGGKEVNT